MLCSGLYFGLGIYLLQNKQYEIGENISFSLLAPPDKFYYMLATIDSIESVKCPLGQTECYRLELGLDSILRLILPTYSIWITKQEPHIPIKYTDNKFTYILEGCSIQQTPSE